MELVIVKTLPTGPFITAVLERDALTPDPEMFVTLVNEVMVVTTDEMVA